MGFVLSSGQSRGSRAPPDLCFNKCAKKAGHYLYASTNVRKSLDTTHKYAILFAATILCAQRLIETIVSDKPNMAKQYFIDKAIDRATFVPVRNPWDQGEAEYFLGNCLERHVQPVSQSPKFSRLSLPTFFARAA